MTVCADFIKKVMPAIGATLHDAIGIGVPNPPYPWPEAKLDRDLALMSHWAYLIRTATGDNAVADYLGNAGLALGAVASPYSSDSDAESAATDVGEVNGYCKYDTS